MSEKRHKKALIFIAKLREAKRPFVIVGEEQKSELTVKDIRNQVFSENWSSQVDTE